MIQESNEDMCGMGISKQSESAKNDRYVSAGAKPEKNACKAEAQCMDNDKRRTTIRRKRTQPFTLAMIYVSYIHSGCSWGGGRGGVKLDEAKTRSRDTFLFTYRFNIT